MPTWPRSAPRWSRTWRPTRGSCRARRCPAPELVSREEWPPVNLDSLAAHARSGGRAPGAAGSTSPGRWRARSRPARPRRSPPRPGLVIGYVSQRVLGQYEVSLLGGDAPPRLLFVAPNLRKAVRELDVDAGRLPPLDLRARADARLPVPGRALAARPPERRWCASTCRAWRCASSAARPAGCRRCRTRRSLVEAFREGGLAALVQTTRAARADGAHAGGDGGGGGLLRARDGRDRRRGDPRPRGLRDAMDTRRRSRSAPERA